MLVSQGVLVCVLGALIMSGISSTATSVNFIVSVLGCRVVGSSFLSVGILGWSLVISSCLLVVSVPVLSVGVILIGLDIVVVSAVLGSLVSRYVFASSCMICALLCLGVLGLVVWGHHMFSVGLVSDTVCYFSVVTVFIAIPTATKVIHWLSSVLFWVYRVYRVGCSSSIFVSASSSALRLINGCLSIRLLGLSSMLSSSPSSTSICSGFSILFYGCNGLLALVCLFVGLFSCGGLSGIVLSNGLVDLVLHDTYFVVAHFHFVLSLGAVLGMFIGMFFYVSIALYSIVSGFVLGWSLNGLSAWVFLAGFLLIFSPLHCVGCSGLPRRITDYCDSCCGIGLLSCLGSNVSLLSFLLFIAYAASCML